MLTGNEGHKCWLWPNPWVTGGEVNIDTILEHREWTHWLSWVFQVMSVFFFVGGYANGTLAGAALDIPPALYMRKYKL